jgi:hypothetical protein
MALGSFIEEPTISKIVKLIEDRRISLQANAPKIVVPTPDPGKPVPASTVTTVSKK